MREILQVQGLTKTFRLSAKQQKLEKTKEKVRTAVDHLSFTAYEGEIFGLLGPNGAGKTTTMRMLSTLLKPTAGSVLINDWDTRKDAIEIKKNIGFLTTEIRLDGQFTPNELAAFYGKLYGLDKKTLEENKRKLFDYFDITQIADRRYETFSTGMKQKTSIAICLIHDPKTIIFDEPTNGLDILTQKQVEDFLLSEKERGKTIVISTHILEVVEALADRVGVIIDGQSVAQGTMEDIIAEAEGKDLREAFIRLNEKYHKPEEFIEEKKGKNKAFGLRKGICR